MAGAVRRPSGPLAASVTGRVPRLDGGPTAYRLDGATGGIDIQRMTDRPAITETAITETAITETAITETAITETAATEAVRRDGYAFVHAAEMRALLAAAGLSDWDGFAASWNDLGIDMYMADGGRYRRRRFACFRATKEAMTRKPHQPHYQSRDYNPLNGGIERWFEPVTDAIAAHPALRAVLTACRTLFDDLTPAALRPPVWHVEIHQFRIEARPGRAGKPTPEGMHRDGVDWVLVLLVSRVNIASGETTIADLAKRPLGSFTLSEPLDAAVTDDNRVFHGVTPVTPLDPTRPGHRDVLVVTFRRE